MNNGVINILKPPGMTSQDVVFDCKRILHVKRVGHTGTLDPGAAGVLPVCVGRATKLFDYLLEKEKEYIAEVKFGMATDTLDSYGVVTDECDTHVPIDLLRTALSSFIGEIAQTIPMYSAASVGGERLYKLARRGETVERAKKQITIYGIDMLSYEGEECDIKSAIIRVKCSKGTYIRTLCSDIGEAVGSLAHMSFLLRTASGSFGIDSAITIDELREAAQNGDEQRYIMPAENVLSTLEKVYISDADAKKKLINGCSTDCKETPNGSVRVYIDDVFFGVGEVISEQLRIKTRFADEE